MEFILNPRLYNCFIFLSIVLAFGTIYIVFNIFDDKINVFNYLPIFIITFLVSFFAYLILITYSYVIIFQPKIQVSIDEISLSECKINNSINNKIEFNYEISKIHFNSIFTKRFTDNKKA